MIASGYVRGNPAKGFASGINVSITADQTLADAVWTLVELDTVSQVMGTEDIGFDVGGEFNTVTHRFVANEAGYYIIIGAVVLDNPPLNTALWVAIKKNGQWMASQPFHASLAGICAWTKAMTIIHLDAGDYIELWAFADRPTAGTTTIDADPTGTYLALYRVA